MEHSQIEQGHRLQLLIKALNLNQTSFARSLGMTQPNISRMVTGENNVSTEALIRITNTHKKVNIHWLLTGEGAMFTDTLPERSMQVQEKAVAYMPRGKGRLEELEERVERLEEAVKQLKKALKK